MWPQHGWVISLTHLFTLQLMVDALKMQPEEKTFPRSLVEAEHICILQHTLHNHVALLRASPTTDRNQTITSGLTSLTCYENTDDFLVMDRFLKPCGVLPNVYHLSKTNNLQELKWTEFDKEVGWRSTAHESRCSLRIQRLTGETPWGVGERTMGELTNTQGDP